MSLWPAAFPVAPHLVYIAATLPWFCRSEQPGGASGLGAAQLHRAGATATKFLCYREDPASQAIDRSILLTAHVDVKHTAGDMTLLLLLLLLLLLPLLLLPLPGNAYPARVTKRVLSAL